MSTDNFRAELDPLEELYGDLEKLIKSSVIKFSCKAEEYESFEQRKYVDQYLDALQKIDKFDYYEYTKEELLAVGIEDPTLITNYLLHKVSLPEGEVRDKLLKNRREEIIRSYVEPNDYYRVLNGIPPLSLELPKITTDIVTNSFLVVSDAESFDTTREDYNSIISVTTARKLMGSLSVMTGMYIQLTEFELAYLKKGFYGDDQPREFRVVPDITPVDYDNNYIFASDAYKLGLKLFPEEMYTLDNQYVVKDANITLPSALGNIYKTNTDYDYFGTVVVRVKNGKYFDTTSIVRHSLEVVPDTDTITDETYESKIYYTDAKLNNPDCKVGDYLILQNFAYPTKEFEDLYGVSSRCPIQYVTERYGFRYTSILEATGYLDQVVAEHPGEEYLEFVGSKKISILDARTAKNFELLYFDASNVKEFTAKMFSTMYAGARDYFVNCVYNPYYRPIYDYYDNFIALAIMHMTIQQVISRTAEGCISRDFYDRRMIQWLFESYGIPYSSRLSYRTQVNLAKNLNMLIMNKGSNKVLYDIAALLGYHDVQIYKYYLMKNRLTNNYGNLKKVHKIVEEPYINSEGEVVDGEHEVRDLEKEYDVYFQKVDLKDINYEKSLTDTTKRESYKRIVEEDPLWWDTNKDTWDEVYGDPTIYLTAEDEENVLHKHYNYTESKYLGVTINYKLSEVLFENTMLLRMLFDMKDEINDIVVTFPNLTGSLEVSLFDAVVFLCALISKQYHIKGNILTDPSKIMHVCEYHDMLSACGENYNEETHENKHEDPDATKNFRADVLAFCFDKVTNAETFQEIVKDPSRYLKPDEVDEFFSYFEILTLPEGDMQEKVAAFNKMFENIRSLGYFIGRKMEESKNAKEYHAWKYLRKALFVGKENSEMFKMGPEETVAETYLDYLKTMNPVLSNIIESVDDDSTYILYNYIDHVIYQMELLIKDMSSMYLRNDSNSTVLKYFMKLLKFFKSYTVDILDLSIEYVFDLKPDNLFKLSVDYEIKKTDELHDPIKLMYGDFCRIIATRQDTDPLWFEEFIALHKDLGVIDSHMKFGSKDTAELYKKLLLRDKSHDSMWDIVHELIVHTYLDDHIKFWEKGIFVGIYYPSKEENHNYLLDEINIHQDKATLDNIGLCDSGKFGYTFRTKDSNKFKDEVFITAVEATE